MSKIHPTAVVEDGAVLADGVEIGPLCYVGPHVRIGEGTRLISHCNIDGYTTLGKNNVVFPFAALGQIAQDHTAKFTDVTYLNIGDGNFFREHCAIHTGAAAGSATVIGNHCMFMNCTHVAHNCKIGNNVLFVNDAAVAGYAEVMDHAIISGLSALHQFCRIGRYSILSGGSVFSKDIPPFMMAEGRNGGCKMINKVGLTRGGFSAEAMQVIKEIFRIYYHSNLNGTEALERIKTELPQLPEVKEFVEFCESSTRGVISARTVNHRE